MRVELIEGCTWISYTSACISEFARKNKFPMPDARQTSCETIWPTGRLRNHLNPGAVRIVKKFAPAVGGRLTEV